MSDSCWEEFKRDREAKWREEELYDEWMDEKLLELEQRLDEEGYDDEDD